ncbi:MAG: type II toxin-antitoxin system HipA family toxin [Bacteroidota bacterium]
MIKHTDLVEVYWDEQKVGRLALGSNNLCLFEYNADYLAKGISLSPFHLPLKAGTFVAKRDPFDGMFGVFNDSLPDGWGNLLLDRFLMSQKFNPSSLTLLDRLSIVGDNGMGVLWYKPINKLTSFTDITDVNFLAKEVKLILNDDYSGSLELLLNKNGSSGGARPKVMIEIDGNPWIIKFASSQDPADIGNIEYEYSQIAKKCGIEMPETRLFEGKYFGVKRFDRNGSKRIHTHSMSGLLYASHRFPSLDYSEMLKATLGLTRDIKEVEKLYRQMIFNVLMGNKDDHAKNFSFILKENSWKLSPAYDLVPSEGFYANHSSTILGQGNPTLKDIFAVAKEVSLSKKVSEKIFEEVYEVCKPFKLVDW